MPCWIFETQRGCSECSWSSSCSEQLKHSGWFVWKAVGQHFDHEMLDDGACRISMAKIHLDPIYRESSQAQILSNNAVLSSLPQASQLQCAAIMRMHVLDNVRQRIEAGHLDFVNEIRRLSILFLGFPGLSKPMNNTHPDEALESLQLAVTNVQMKMVEFDGSFLQFRCDEKGFLAICAFGLPGRTHLNDCCRAIDSALKIVSSMGEIGHQVVIGVTTGDLLCACVGSNIRAEYTVFGDAINLSARLMCKGKCGLGDVLCDQTTHESAKRIARFVPLTPIFVKGKSEPISVFSVHAIGSDAGNRTRQTCRSYSRKISKLKPIIGHTGILTDITEVINHATVKSETKAFLIEGGPGYGKTRVVDELQKKTFEAQESKKHAFHCQGDGACKSIPLYPWRRVFEDLFVHDKRLPPRRSSESQTKGTVEDTLGLEYHATPLDKRLSTSVEGYGELWRIRLAGILELPLEIVPKGDSQLEECIMQENHDSTIGALVSLAALLISIQKCNNFQQDRTMMKLSSMQEEKSMFCNGVNDINDGTLFSQKRKACTVEEVEWIHHKTSKLDNKAQLQTKHFLYSPSYPKRRNIEMSANLKTKKLLDVLVEVCQIYIRVYGPMVIFLEDMHHFDTMSWNLLKLLLEEIRFGCIIVGTLRGNDGSLSAHAQATRVSLCA